MFSTYELCFIPPPPSYILFVNTAHFQKEEYGIYWKTQSLHHKLKIFRRIVKCSQLAHFSVGFLGLGAEIKVIYFIFQFWKVICTDHDIRFCQSCWAGIFNKCICTKFSEIKIFCLKITKNNVLDNVGTAPFQLHIYLLLLFAQVPNWSHTFCRFSESILSDQKMFFLP